MANRTHSEKESRDWFEWLQANRHKTFRSNELNKIVALFRIVGKWSPSQKREFTVHYRLVSILRRFQKAPATQLDRPEIIDACRHVNHTLRNRLLDPVAIIHATILAAPEPMKICEAGRW